MELDKAIKERHCVRNFKKTKKPDYRDIIEAIDSANKAPLAGNIAAVRYFLIQDKAKIKGLAKAAQQSFIEDASYVLIICIDKRDLQRSYYDRAKMYASQEAGAAAENFMLKIAELGLATCWVSAFSEETIRHLLALPDHIGIEILLPIGYELGKTKQKPKPDLDRVVRFDVWGDEGKYMKPRRYPLGSQT